MDHPCRRSVAFKRSSGFNTPLEGTTSTTKERETPERLKLKLALERLERKVTHGDPWFGWRIYGGFSGFHQPKKKGVVKGWVVIYGGYNMLQGVNLQSLLWDYYGLTNQIRG